MEKQLKYVLLLSLKEMALRRVAVILWSDSDILASISKFRTSWFSNEESEKEWREIIEHNVKDKMLKLELPKSLTKQMIDIVRRIGLQIRRWKECQEDYLRNDGEAIILPNSAKLCWTTAGTIDYRKTAEELVRCDMLDLVQRYKLACINCLEDYIPLLWEELPEEMKVIYGNDKYLCADLSFCWPHILKGEHFKLNSLLRTWDRIPLSFNQYAFETSVEDGNKSATEYFFQKLTHEEREASVMRTVVAVIRNIFRTRSLYLCRFRCQKLSEILCYLLSLMTPDQQMEIFKEHSSGILLRFLDWPWPDLYLANTGLIWTFLPPSGYGDLLRKMADRFEMLDHYCPILFQEFFIRSPLDLKKCFVDQKSEFGFAPACRFLAIFFRSEDSESIEVIFRNVDAADKVKLVFHPGVLELFYDFMLMDKWHMVEVCLREATLSKEDRGRLKGVFMVFLQRKNRGQIEWGNRNLKRLFEFLEDTDALADKEKKFQT
ncbi:hypothetical protein AVEN_9562-1 [Araneus ventricosus]|uniref:Uncharacterized protein n=1 Tax=Araneus ventricosus TaxID=182803 RepID=A0A4Y2JC32_ARAVE|nr:hypothetical protein AVEN_9562-1 [Araneus ventricosus]